MARAQAGPSPAPALSANGDADSESKWVFVPSLSIAGEYDDNLFITPTDKHGDSYLVLAPTFAVGEGDFRGELAPYAPIPHFLARTGEEFMPWKNFVFASYTPEQELYSKYHHEDVLNHDLRLEEEQERDLWTTQATVRFQTASDASVDVGRRIDQYYYTVDLRGTYELTGKITGGAELIGDRSDYSGGFSSTDMRATIFADYQIAPKTAVGLALVGGYLRVDQGANQSYGQPLLEIKYKPTAKVWVVGKFGDEYRHYDGGVSNRSDFVFDFDANYQPGDGTTLTLSSRRDTEASARYAGENIFSTVYEASIRQRFLQRVYLTLSGGDSHNQYENNEPNSFVPRRDDYYYYRAALACDVSAHGTAQLSYQHRENHSTIASFEFNDNQISLSVVYLF